MSTDVHRVKAVMPIFVLKYANAYLMWGCPWERYVRAQYIDEEDRSLTAIIWSLDGKKVVKFCAAPVMHERNRLRFGKRVRIGSVERRLGPDPVRPPDDFVGRKGRLKAIERCDCGKGEYCIV